MSKSYKVVKKTMNMGEKKGQTVYSVRPVSYGTLTTEEVAKQISTESTATTADVRRYSTAMPTMWWRTLPRVTTSSFLVSVLFISASSPTRRCLNLRRRMPTW